MLPKVGKNGPMLTLDNVSSVISAGILMQQGLHNILRRFGVLEKHRKTNTERQTPKEQHRKKNTKRKTPKEKHQSQSPKQIGIF